LSDFCRGTLDERRQFDYSAIQDLIKLTIEGKKDPIAIQMATSAPWSSLMTQTYSPLSPPPRPAEVRNSSSTAHQGRRCRMADAESSPNCAPCAEREGQSGPESLL